MLKTKVCVYTPTTPFMGIERECRKPFATLIGIPYDSTSSYRPGSRYGPIAIRKASLSLEPCSIYTDIDVSTIPFIDLGDLVVPYEPRKAVNIIASCCGEIAKKTDILIAFGGEHTITYGILKGLTSLQDMENLCVVVFDAHLDLRTQYQGEDLCHATVMNRIIEDIQSIKRIVFIGTRAISYEETSKLQSLKKTNTVTVVRSTEIHSVNRILKELGGCRSLYISIDVDVLDPTYAPGVQTPEPFGLNPKDLMGILENICRDFGRNIVGIDIVEYTPIYDVGEQTAFLIARIVMELMAFIAKSRNINSLNICQLF